MYTNRNLILMFSNNKTDHLIYKNMIGFLAEKYIALLVFLKYMSLEFGDKETF